MKKFVQLITLCFCAIAVFCEPCIQRTFDYDSFVCVCNENECGTIGKVEPPLDGYLHIITSSRDEFRFQLETRPIVSNISDQASVRIFVNASDIRQQMIGFGGAFTDATGINIVSLSIDLQDEIVRQYYSPEGIEYNTGRIPIGGCDFSTHPYSYDDIDGDVELLYFNLTQEDHLYKIPFIKRAMELSDRPINLFASPWSPPSWMKVSGTFNGTGGLLPEMQQPWANYFVKFLDAYGEEGISLWGLTAQNEPTAGTTNWGWNECKFTAEQQRDFVRDFLGPTLTASGYRSLKLMIADENRHIFPEYPIKILNDSEASAFIDGVAVHWYVDSLYPASVVTAVHDAFPDKFLLYTEACNGDFPRLGTGVYLGSWDRGENYASDIIEDVNNWSAGWTDWNMALDMKGGPNWASNFVDSPIVVNPEANEFYKQPMFYAMGHFSKFVTEGSVSLGIAVGDINMNQEVNIGPGHVEAASFTDLSGYTVIVILNKNNKENDVLIEDSNGNIFTLLLPAKSLQTVIYH